MLGNKFIYYKVIYLIHEHLVSRSQSANEWEDYLN